MSDYIASVDAGNGGTHAVLALSKGYKSFYEPSVRAAATGDSLGLGKGWELDYDYVDWNGHRYVTGDDVVRITRRQLERHMGANRYGNEFHQMLVAHALARLGIKSGTVDLTLFAPPGMYNDLKVFVHDRFSVEDIGRRDIPFVVEDETGGCSNAFRPDSHILVLKLTRLLVTL